MKKVILSLSILFVYLTAFSQSYDMAMDEITVESNVSIANAPYNLTGVVQNLGSETINSFDINYSINGGPVQTFTISGQNIVTSDIYTFTKFNGFDPGIPYRYPLRVWVSNPNGMQDENTMNDEITKNIEVYDQIVDRNALHEVFTSSTCGPCNPGNQQTNSVWSASTETPVILKYQMSWPGTGDPYYTSEGNARRNFYGVNSVPNMAVDGGWNGNSNSYSTTLLDEFSAKPAFLEMESYYSVNGQTVDINVAIKPLKTFQGDVRLQVAIIENETFNNVKTNGETEFEYVMKKMVPNQNGTTVGSLLPGEPVTFSYSYTFQGNYRLPNNANDPINHSIEHSVEEFTDLGVVVFMQDNGSKTVHHSTFSNDKSVSLDMGMMSITSTDSTSPNTDVTISGEVVNNSTTTVTSFDVVYTVDGGFPFRHSVTGVNLDQGDTYNFSHADLWTPDAEGFYKIEARIDNVNGNGTNVSDDITLNDEAYKWVVVMDGLAGFPSHELAKTISFYPNPSTGMVYIDAEASIVKEVEVYTLMGQKVRSMEISSSKLQSLDLSDLANGTYILRFNSDDSSFSERVVIE